MEKPKGSANLLIVILIALAVTVSSLAVFFDATYSDSSWAINKISQFAFDPENSGRSPFAGPQTGNGRPLFIDKPGPGCNRQIQMTTPVLDSKGNLYFGTSEGSFISITPQGKELWRFKLPDAYPRTNCGEGIGEKELGDRNIAFMPAFDGTTIYFGTSGILNTKKIYALNTSGKVKWQYDIDEMLQSPIKIGYDGRLYFTTLTSLYSLDTTGKDAKKYSVISGHMNYPAIAKDGTIYVCSAQGLVALDSNFNKKWIYSTGNLLGTCQPSVDSKTGVVYFPERNRDKQEYKLDALNPDGTLKWSANVFWIESTATIAEDGTIYVSTTDLSIDTKPTSHQVSPTNGVLFALNPDGTEKWRYHVPTVIVCKQGTDPIDCPNSDLWKNANAIDISPIIGKDGTLYFGSDDTLFFALNPNGTVKWTHKYGDEWDHKGMIAPDGTLYAVPGGGRIGGIYVFSDTAGSGGQESTSSGNQCQVGQEQGVTCSSATQCSSRELVNGCCIGGTCS